MVAALNKDQRRLGDYERCELRCPEYQFDELRNNRKPGDVKWSFAALDTDYTDAWQIARGQK